MKRIDWFPIAAIGVVAGSLLMGGCAGEGGQAAAPDGTSSAMTLSPREVLKPVQGLQITTLRVEGMT